MWISASSSSLKAPKAAGFEEPFSGFSVRESEHLICKIFPLGNDVDKVLGSKL